MKLIYFLLTTFLVSFAFSFVIFNSKPSQPQINNIQTKKHITNLTIKPTPTPTPSPTHIPQFINQTLPFTPQAPSAQWSNPIFQDACEEASIIMANAWLNNQTVLTINKVEQDIQKLVDYQKRLFNTSVDTSAKDTNTLFKNYYNHQNTLVINNPTQQTLINHLAQKSLIIIPTNGQILSNPHYTPPGPERHMVVITGYDLSTKEFITHDPGTRFGKNYRYSFSLLIRSIADYPTGNRKPTTTRPKNAIIVKK